MTPHQLAIARDIAHFVNDPLGFVLYAYPWGKPGTPLEDFPDGPDAWHRELFVELAKHVTANIFNRENKLPQVPYQCAVASGHGVGKSACVAWLIDWLMSTRRHCRGVVTANTGDQLNQKTWPELKKWHAMSVNKEWFVWTATKFYCVLETQGEDNWRFDAVTWSEDHTESFAGMHNASSAVVMIFDEASAIPDKIWEVAEGAMTDGEGFWLAFGNPTRNTGRFRQCFGKLRSYWITRHVDSRSVRITNKPLFQRWIEAYGEDSDFVRVRVKGQFPRGGGKQWIPIDVVEGAQERAIHPDPGAPLIMGVDPARYGEDQLVIRWRRGRDARSIPPTKFRGMDNMEAANRIAELVDKYNPDCINIDAGAGSGIIDRLRQMHYRVNEIWFGVKLGTGAYANKRTELWGKMRDWLSGAAIDADQELSDDLIGPEYGFSGREGDQFILESKDVMKARGLSSPDNGDALACTFAVNVARNDHRHSRGARAVRVAKNVDYAMLS